MAYWGEKKSFSCRCLYSSSKSKSNRTGSASLITPFLNVLLILTYTFPQIIAMKRTISEPCLEAWCDELSYSKDFNQVRQLSDTIDGSFSF